MKIKKIVVRWLVTGIETDIAEDNKTVNSLMPLLDALFPGINYYSITGFSQAMKECAIPALKKLFPDLQEDLSGHAAAPDETVDISAFLPSDGYEWQNSDDWKRRFKGLIAGAAQ